MMLVASSRFGAIRATYEGRRGSGQEPRPLGSDLVQIAPLDKGDQFIPFGMREPDGICILADPDALISDFDLGALRQSGQRVNLSRSISTSSLIAQVKNPTVRSRYGCKRDFSYRKSTSPYMLGPKPWTFIYQWQRRQISWHMPRLPKPPGPP